MLKFQCFMIVLNLAYLLRLYIANKKDGFTDSIYSVDFLVIPEISK